MNDLISVIVTLRNNDLYVSECLDSIIEQTYSNIEIIVIDCAVKPADLKHESENETKDKSGHTQLQKEYEQHLGLLKIYESIENVKIVSLPEAEQENNDVIEPLYLNNAKIFGANIAKGKYILFMNGGDILTNDYIRALALQAKANDADMAISEMAVTWNNYPNAQYYNLDAFRIKNYDLKNGDCFNEFIKSIGLWYGWYYLCNKLIRKDLWNNCADKISEFFGNKTYGYYFGEDIVFSAVIWLNSKHTINVHNNYYIFRWINEDFSIKHQMETSGQENIKFIIESWKFFENILKDEGMFNIHKDNFNEFKKTFVKRFLYRVSWAISGKEKDIIQESLKKTFNIDDLALTPREVFFEQFHTDLYPKYSVYEETIKAIVGSKTEYILFDAFDTLVLRPFFYPTDLFELLSEPFNELMNTTGFVDFAPIRREGEAAARQYYNIFRPNFEDVNLDEIYDTINRDFNIPKDITDKLKEIEISLEKKFCYRRNTGYELFRLAKDCNKNIIVASDMYLGKETIEWILKNCGYSDFELWVSNDIGASKHSGALYREILRDYGEEDHPEKFIVIGDNYFSEVIIPAKIGISGFHLPMARDVFCNENHYFNVGNYYKKAFKPNGSVVSGEAAMGYIGIRCMLAVAANKIFDFPFISYDMQTDYNLDPRIIGTYSFGTFLLSCAKWLIDNTRNKGIQILHFASRDGFFLKQAYEKLAEYVEGSPNTNYLHVSRKALMPLAVENGIDMCECFNMSQLPHQTPKKIIKLLSPLISKNKLEKAEVTCRKNNFPYNKEFGNLSSFYKFISVFEKQFMDKEYVSHYRKSGKIYFASIIKESDVIFDIGYSGRSEMILTKLLGRPVNSYYLHTHEEISNKRQKKGNFSISSFLPYCPTSTFVVREQMMLPQQPSCIGYDFDENKPIFEKHESNYAGDLILSIMQENAIGFVNDFCDFFGDFIDKMYFRYYDAAMPMEIFLHYPRKKDKQIFKCISLEDNFGMANVFNLTQYWEEESEKYNLNKLFQD